MEVAKKETPVLIQLFTNLLWANSPSGWIIEDRCNKKTLFVSISVPNVDNKIYRTFLFKDIDGRSKDLWGMANDCLEEIKTAIQNC
jgi:hypothetical protein